MGVDAVASTWGPNWVVGVGVDFHSAGTGLDVLVLASTLVGFDVMGVDVVCRWLPVYVASTWLVRIEAVVDESVNKRGITSWRSTNRG